MIEMVCTILKICSCWMSKSINMETTPVTKQVPEIVEEDTDEPPAYVDVIKSY